MSISTPHRRRAVRRTATIAATAAVMIAGGTAVQADDGPLKLGALMPMTGDLQAYGQTSLNGIELAAKEINDAGGVLGQDMEIELGDTQTNPQSGIDAAKQLVSIDGVSGIVGALSSGVTIPVSQSVTSKEGIPQISGASTSPVITGLDDNDFMFRTVPSDAFQGRALAEVVAENGLSNVSILYVNNDYGEGLADSFEAAFEEHGGSVEQRNAFEQGNASYRGEVSGAADGDPEALVVIGYPESGITILRQALEGGHFDRFVFTDGLKAPEIIDSLGAEVLEGSFGTAPQALTDTDSAEHFRSAYEGEYGEVPPKPFIDTAYDATWVLALAAQAAGSTDGEAVRDALRDVANPPGEQILPGEWSKAMELLADGEDINYTGASGSVDFDDNGDVSGTFAHWVIRDGEITTEKVFEPSN
ncbi:MAG: ABC transporter substrate-binding protein [Halofilum sp. (in: g-proteobacteria)]|nr:ABC transporter substrate-binding protein [Halofilum sp. (in: g-proteobacteria)]